MDQGRRRVPRRKPAAKAKNEEFDVFVSYNRDDKDQVVAICSKLKEAGIRVWVDADLVPGDKWRRKVWKILDQVPSVVVFLSDNGCSEEQLYEIELAEHQRARIIPAFLPYTSDKAKMPNMLKPFQWVDFRFNPSEALASLIAGIKAAVAARKRTEAS